MESKTMEDYTILRLTAYIIGFRIESKESHDLSKLKLVRNPGD